MGPVEVDKLWDEFAFTVDHPIHHADAREKGCRPQSSGAREAGEEDDCERR
jgi:hypothetical protein